MVGRRVTTYSEQQLTAPHIPTNNQNALLRLSSPASENSPELLKPSVEIRQTLNIRSHDRVDIDKYFRIFCMILYKEGRNICGVVGWIIWFRTLYKAILNFVFAC